MSFIPWHGVTSLWPWLRKREDAGQEDLGAKIPGGLLGVGRAVAHAQHPCETHVCQSPGSTHGVIEEDLLTDVCREVVERWSDSQVVDAKEEKEDEVQAITSMMEKQARIVVKPREVSQEEKQRKAALLAQYANVTDEEEYPFLGEVEQTSHVAQAVSHDLTLFRNTNVEDVLNARKLERELLRDEFQRKKEQDKLQREKDKLAKQERKEKEKKRTQKGERKR
uniref:Coiled-coil domain containing 43 n=1 Tax=Ficedula albicollis TaxID=59894 RepID=A0A803VX11_FICAL